MTTRQQWALVLTALAAGLGSNLVDRPLSLVLALTTFVLVAVFAAAQLNRR